MKKIKKTKKSKNINQTDLFELLEQLEHLKEVQSELNMTSSLGLFELNTIVEKQVIGLIRSYKVNYYRAITLPFVIDPWPRTNHLLRL